MGDGDAPKGAPLVGSRVRREDLALFTSILPHCTETSNMAPQRRPHPIQLEEGTERPTSILHIRVNQTSTHGSESILELCLDGRFSPEERGFGCRTCIAGISASLLSVPLLCFRGLEVVTYASLFLTYAL